MLAGHELYPALVVDRQWQLVASNLAELALEAFLPADAATTAILREYAADRG